MWKQNKKYHIGWIFRIMWKHITRNITLGGYLESCGNIIRNITLGGYLESCGNRIRNITSG